MLDVGKHWKSDLRTEKKFFFHQTYSKIRNYISSDQVIKSYSELNFENDFIIHLKIVGNSLSNESIHVIDGIDTYHFIISFKYFSKKPLYIFFKYFSKKQCTYFKYFSKKYDLQIEMNIANILENYRYWEIFKICILFFLEKYLKYVSKKHYTSFKYFSKKTIYIF